MKWKVYVRADMRPEHELQPTDHPLAIEQPDGITLDRVRELIDRAPA